MKVREVLEQLKNEQQSSKKFKDDSKYMMGMILKGEVKNDSYDTQIGNFFFELKKRDLFKHLENLNAK